MSCTEVLEGVEEEYCRSGCIIWGREGIHWGWSTGNQEVAGNEHRTRGKDKRKELLMGTTKMVLGVVSRGSQRFHGSRIKVS